MLLAEAHPSGAFALLEIVDAARGLWLADLVLKAAPVRILMCRTCEPGKFLLAFTGDVASVESSYARALAEGGDAVLDRVLLPGAHGRLWQALGVEAPAGTPEGDSAPEGDGALPGQSLLTLECFTVAATLAALDAGLKAAGAQVLRLHLADDYGGKGYFLLRGDLHDLEAVVEAARVAAGPRLVADRLIPRPDPDLPPAPGEALVLRLPARQTRS